MNTKLPLIMAGALVLAACGGGSDGATDSFDADRACRIGQRLVDETASGDRDGVVTQIERLDELDGIADSALDVDELDALAEDLDENSVEDLIAEFDAIGCDLDTPEIEPTTTEPAPETVPVTEPTASTVPATEPADTTPATEPATTEAPATTAATEPAPGDGTGIPIDIGSTGPGPELGVNRPTEAILAEFEIADMLYSPNTNVVELWVSRRDATFSDDIEWSSNDSITLSATTSMSLEDVRAAYRTAIEGLGFDYDFTESTSSSDGTSAVGVDADPSDFDPTIPRWSIDVAQNDDVPGVVLIEIDRNVDRPGTLPAIPGPAVELLQETAVIGADLGWAVTGFRYSESANTFSGGTYVSGSVDWDVSEDNTVAASATALQEAVGLPIRDEEIEEDRITWFLDDDSSTLFSINYFEFGGTTASFNP